ncbi:MAG: outer membrane protein transport protein [Gammaproteobacteria bacterium]|nr:outer membrane protein transport protein [Gammaproteobacteria bacterium]
MANHHPFVRISWISGIAGLLSILSAGANASGFALIEQSVSSMGTAYAQGSSGIDDASTIYFNPAGMTRLPGRNVTGGVHVVDSNVDFKGSAVYNPTHPGFAGGPPAGASIAGADDIDIGLTQPVPNFYYSHAYSPRSWIGIGVNAPFGLKTDYDANWIGRYHADKSELITININPSFAFKINEHASIGLGISTMYADAELTNWADVGLQSGLPGTSDALATVKGDDWGFGFNGGIILQPSPQTRLGLHYRSQVNLELEGDFTLTGITSTGASAEVSLPGTLSFSAYHEYNNQWAVMADVTWTEWSQLDSLVIKRTGTEPIISEFDWDDSFRVAIGATYRYNPTWLFRAGLAFDETPIRNADLRTPRVPGEDRTWLAFGANYKYSKELSFDFGYAHLFVDDPKINNLDAYTPSTFTGFHLLTGEYDAAVDIFSAQVNWKF